MSKKPIMAAIILITFLFSLLAVTFSASLATANFVVDINAPPVLFLESPRPMVYSENSLNLSFSRENIQWGIVEYSDVKYWLDGKMLGQLDILTDVHGIGAYSVNLTGLSDGQHVVEVTATATLKQILNVNGVVVRWISPAGISTGKVTFTIDATIPEISILSWQNRTFETVNVPLNFTVTKPVSELCYSLDGHNNFTFTDNTTVTHIYGRDNYDVVLPNLEEGSHNLKIYCTDAVGHTGESETYFFAVNTQPTPSLSPSTASSPSPLSEVTLPPTSASPSVPEFPPWTALPLIAMATLVTALFLTRRKATQNSNH